MAINKSAPMRFTPRGLVDAFDATDKFQGACQRLTNLVFDPANPELVVTRPGVTQMASFATSGFASPGFISVHAAIGTRIYGMIATARNPGFDEPFMFDTGSGAFVPLTGITSANVPASPVQGGDWVPPTIAAVGTMIIVTHPGFSGGAGQFFGVFDVTNPAAPVWHSYNTATNGLPSVPQAVANFNNRAYFACANQLFYTDELTNPPTITNASQFLTIGDTSAINALSGLPIQTTSSGVLQTLTVFKTTQIWQVSGDTSFSNLALNYMSLTVGTSAPRSVAQSPFGLYFISQGGPYFLDLLGTVRALTYSGRELEPDLSTPFENAVTPTRWAAAYNSTVYRICGQTVLQGAQQTNDYWFDEHKRRWNGPHTFAYDCASPQAGYFVLSSVNNPGVLVQSFPVANTAFQAVDLGTGYSVSLLSSSFPKTDWMAVKQVAESQIEFATNQCFAEFSLTAQDDQGASLGACSIDVLQPGVNIWGAFNWGAPNKWGCPEQGTWGSGLLWGSPPIGSGAIWGAGTVTPVPHTYPVPWPAPLVFEKMQLAITLPVAQRVAIGTFYARYQKSGYMVTQFQ